MIKDDMLTTRFRKPIKLDGVSATITSIIRLILLTPGENQSHPEMGVGLVSKYRYSYEEDIKTIEEKILEQIQTYLPMLTDVKVNLSMVDAVLIISLEITGLIISLELKDENLVLKDVKEPM